MEGYRKTIFPFLKKERVRKRLEFWVSFSMKRREGKTLTLRD